MEKLLSLGWISSVLFIAGTLILGLLLDGYDHIAQTTVEIAETGSPFYWHFHLLAVTTNLLIILFGIGLLLLANQMNMSILPALFIIAAGIGDLGTLFFTPPIFDFSMLMMMIGFFAPLVFAISWKKMLGNSFMKTSIVISLCIVIGIVLNLAPSLLGPAALNNYYGLIQKFVLYTFYMYCAYLSVHITKYSSLAEQKKEAGIDF